LNVSLIRKIILFSLIAIISASIAEEYNLPGIKVDTVLIIGNNKTKSEVILREIPFNFPHKIGQFEINYIKNRVQNLFLFNQVEVTIKKQALSQILLIEVKETWYIYPVPLLFINERDWSKWSYGFQLTHSNFRGMNEQLSLGGWAGYNPSFFINYYNPWIGKKARLIFGLNLFGRRVANKFLDFDEQHLGGKVSFGRRLTHKISLEGFFDSRRITVPIEYKIYMASGTNKDLVPKYGVVFRYDGRDLFEYPKSGFFISYAISHTGFNKNQPLFWRFEFDNRLYILFLEKYILAGRNLLRLNVGDLPIYDRVFIGYGDRIRGYFNRVFTDQNLMLQNVEYRIPIIPVRYHSWENAPLFSPFFQGLKFGISMGIFADTGIVWDDGRQFALTNFYTGYGAGIHFHLPYIYLFRIDWAINDQGNTELIFDLGVSF
jgi:outer membrane protein assembly factor BamA